MFNLSPERLLVIAVVAIILLGPDKLPQVAKQAGAAWRALTEFRHRMESEVRSNLPDLPSTTEIARLARSPSALLDHLSSMSEDDVAEGDAAVGEDQGPAPITGPGEVVGNGPVPDGAGTDGAGTGGAGSNGTGSNEMWSNGAGSDGAGSNGAGSNGAGSNGSGAPVSVEGAAEEPERRSPPVAPPPRRRGSAANEPIVSGDPTLN